MCENRNLDTLVIANISSNQHLNFSRALNRNQFYFTRISSTGGLLYSSTETLLIGIKKDRYEELLALLHKYCKKQLTHITTQTQLESHFQPSQPTIIEAETGGATLLTLPIEHFEQY